MTRLEEYAGVLVENDCLPLAGLPVVEAKAMLKDAWGIPYFADAFVNGRQVPVAHVLQPGDRLEFVQRFGIKANDDEDAELAMAEALLKAEPELARLVDDVSKVPMEMDEGLALMALKVFQWSEKRFGPITADAVAVLNKWASELSRLANGGASPAAVRPERAISHRVRVDFAGRKVVIDGVHHALDKVYLAILECLVVAGGALVSAPEMKKQSKVLMDEERIDRLIAKLKRDNEKVGDLIESATGKGYRIVMPD